MDTMKGPAPITSAVIAVGQSEFCDVLRQPVHDVALHVFIGSDLIATNKLPRVPSDAMGYLLQFAGQYTRGKYTQV